MIDSIDGGILHMLSPGINPTILSRFKTSQLTANQSPSHKESTMLSSSSTTSIVFLLKSLPTSTSSTRIPLSLFYYI